MFGTRGAERMNPQPGAPLVPGDAKFFLKQLHSFPSFMRKQAFLKSIKRPDAICVTPGRNHSKNMIRRARQQRSLSSGKLACSFFVKS